MDNEENEQEQDYQVVYSKNVIEFATVAREYCVFAENAKKYSKADYLKVASRLLPLLYMKGALLPDTKAASDEDLPEIVDYDTYEGVRRGIRILLSEHDGYLTTFKEDFRLSETPIFASISEDMADIYQDIRNFCEQYHCGDDVVMNDAVACVVDKFRNYWGQKTANALGAINAVLYSGDDLSDKDFAGDIDMEMGREEDDIENEEQSANDQTANDDAPYFLRQTGMRLVGGKNKGK